MAFIILWLLVVVFKGDQTYSKVWVPLNTQDTCIWTVLIETFASDTSGHPLTHLRASPDISRDTSWEFCAQIHLDTSLELWRSLRHIWYGRTSDLHYSLDQQVFSSYLSPSFPRSRGQQMKVKCFIPQKAIWSSMHITLCLYKIKIIKMFSHLRVGEEGYFFPISTHLEMLGLQWQQRSIIKIRSNSEIFWDLF